jgi:hypothetical protein
MLAGLVQWTKQERVVHGRPAVREEIERAGARGAPVGRDP